MLVPTLHKSEIKQYEILKNGSPYEIYIYVLN